MRLGKADRVKLATFLLTSAAVLWDGFVSNLSANGTFGLGVAWGATTALVYAWMFADIERKRRLRTARRMPSVATTTRRTDQP
jgi:hypothetical protein